MLIAQLNFGPACLSATTTPTAQNVLTAVRAAGRFSTLRDLYGTEVRAMRKNSCFYLIRPVLNRASCAQ